MKSQRYTVWSKSKRRPFLLQSGKKFVRVLLKVNKICHRLNSMAQKLEEEHSGTNLVKNEKDMAMIEGKMADPFFSKQEN